MPEKTRRVRLQHLRWPNIYEWGIRVKYRPAVIGQTQLIFILQVAGHCWELFFFGRRKAPWLAKPSKPKWWQGTLCVVGILGLQALMNWMDAAPFDDLLVAAAMLGLLFAIWVAYRLTQ